MALNKKILEKSLFCAAIALSLGMASTVKATTHVDAPMMKSQWLTPNYSSNEVEARIQKKYFLTTNFMQNLSMLHATVGHDDNELVLYPESVQRLLNTATSYALETNAHFFYLAMMNQPDETEIDAYGARAMATFINNHDEFTAPGQVLYAAYVISSEIQAIQLKYADQPKRMARKIAVKLKSYDQFLSSFDSTNDTHLSRKFNGLQRMLTTDSMKNSYTVTDVFVGQ